MRKENKNDTWEMFERSRWMLSSVPISKKITMDCNLSVFWDWNVQRLDGEIDAKTNRYFCTIAQCIYELGQCVLKWKLSSCMQYTLLCFVTTISFHSRGSMFTFHKRQHICFRLQFKCMDWRWNVFTNIFLARYSTEYLSKDNHKIIKKVYKRQMTHLLF